MEKKLGRPELVSGRRFLVDVVSELDVSCPRELPEGIRTPLELLRRDRKARNNPATILTENV